MQVTPLAQRVTESMFQIAAEFEMALSEEIANHKNTLGLLQRLKSGDVSIDRVVVSDDGWQVMPPEMDEKESVPFGNGNSPEPAYVG